MSRGQQIWFILAFTGIGLSWWSYVGPFRWISEAQLAMFGSYSSKMSFVLCALVFVLPGQYVFRNVGTRSDEPPTANAWSAHQLWFLAVPAALLVMAIYLRQQASHLKLETTTAAELETGASAPSRWLAIDGVALSDASLCLKYNECYMPVVSRDWKPDMAIAVFLKTRCSSDQVPEAGVFKGIVSYVGMPGHVRAGFERAPIKLRPGFLVLAWKEGPKDVRFDSNFIAGTAAVVGLIVAVLLLRDYVRAQAIEAADGERRSIERARMLEAMREGRRSTSSARPIEPT
jgi:hypothetical protein